MTGNVDGTQGVGRQPARAPEPSKKAPDLNLEKLAIWLIAEKESNKTAKKNDANAFLKSEGWNNVDIGLLIEDAKKRGDKKQVDSLLKIIADDVEKEVKNEKVPREKVRENKDKDGKTRDGEAFTKITKRPDGSYTKIIFEKGSKGKKIDVTLEYDKDGNLIETRYPNQPIKTEKLSRRQEEEPRTIPASTPAGPPPPATSEPNPPGPTERRVFRMPPFKPVPAESAVAIDPKLPTVPAADANGIRQEREIVINEPPQGNRKMPEL